MEKDLHKIGLSKNTTLVSQLQEFQENPRSLRFVELARTYRKEGLIHQAISILDEGLEFHPNLYRAFIEKAECFFALRRYADCLILVNRVLSVSPENIKAQRLQARIYNRLNQKEAAYLAYKNVLQLNSFDWEAKDYVEQYEKAIFAEKKQMEVLQPNCEGKLSDFTINNNGRAGQLFESSVLLPSAQEASGQKVAANKEDQILEGDALAEADSNEFEPFATRTIAELYLRQELFAKAESILRKILAKNPDDAWAVAALSNVMRKQKAAPQPTSRDVALAKAALLDRFLKRIEESRQAKV